MENHNEVRKNTNIQPHGIKMRPFNNMMLILTKNCNLRCSYCYEQGHKYNAHSTMSIETAKKAVKLFFKQVPQSMNQTSISFFGGEPHLAFDLIKQIVEYSFKHRTIAGYKGNKYNYVVNTNGIVLTDEMFELYKALGKRVNIRISIDGYKENHDVTRKTIDGAGSWQLLEKNMPRYRTLREKYGVQINTITTINKSNCKDIYYNFSKIYEFTGMSSAFLFVHEDMWTQEDFKIIKEQIGMLYEYCLSHKIMLPLCNIKPQNNGANSTEFSPICSAAANSFTVDPEGIIHPCQRSYFGDLGDLYIMGDVNTGISQAKRAFMHEINNIAMLPLKCQKCNPVIRRRCHICFPANKIVYDDPHTIPNRYCMLQKEIYYMLLEKEEKAAEEEDIFE